MIESTTNSNEFRSKDGTVVRIPDADFNIVPRSVTKNTTPCSTRIRTTTICVNNQGLIGLLEFKQMFVKREIGDRSLESSVQGVKASLLSLLGDQGRRLFISGCILPATVKGLS
ncbi:hypothetical protein TNCV_2543691 [Trichonephila clavipes]|nr:hypothetical protein TNCV_2543691 [Trichonephila clavipes]